MDLNDFEPTRRLSTRAEARDAFDASLSEAAHRVCMFDDRGEFYGLQRRSVAESLRTLLLRDRDSRATLVLRDTGHIERRCSLLMDLLRSHAPRLSIALADESLREHHRGLVVVDRAVVLRRPHFDQSITWIDYDEKAIATADRLFEEMLGHAARALSGRPGGL